MTMDEARVPLWRHPLLVASAAGIGLVFCVGVVTGVVAGTMERGAIKPLAVAFLAGAVVVAALCGWLLRRALPALYPAAPPRVSRSRRLLTWSAVIGGAIGMLMVLASVAAGTKPPDMFSNEPISPWAAAAFVVIVLIVVPPLTWAWHRSIDEHEASAYRDGTLAGIYAYCAIAPTWWMGWRGGFLPEPQEMITFMAVMVVWGLVWLIRRYG
jgi:hypothetical protein